MASGRSHDSLDGVTTAVTRAVADRLGGDADGDLVRTVVREVVTAMASDPRPATSPDARDNGDGTVTTGLGAVVPRPDSEAALAFCGACVETRRGQRDRAVVTVTGRNGRGIVATIASRIAESGGDIEDLSQTLVNDYFTMIILVDTSRLEVPFDAFKAHLIAAASAVGAHAVVMHESVMQALQRV